MQPSRSSNSGDRENRLKVIPCRCQAAGVISRKTRFRVKLTLTPSPAKKFLSPLAAAMAWPVGAGQSERALPCPACAASTLGGPPRGGLGSYEPGFLR
jgi:hypothetical protein